jgi:hypothetical protein
LAYAAREDDERLDARGRDSYMVVLILIVVGGLVGAGIGMLANWITRPQWAEDRPWAVYLAILVMAIIGGILGWIVSTMTTSAASPSLTEPTAAVITVPSNGETVQGTSLTAAGTAVRDDQHPLLCVIQNSAGNYYIYQVQFNSATSWTCRVGLGPARIRTSLGFTLILASTSPSRIDSFRRMREADAVKFDQDGIGGELPADVIEISRAGLQRSQ